MWDLSTVANVESQQAIEKKSAKTNCGLAEKSRTPGIHRGSCTNLQNLHGHCNMLTAKTEARARSWEKPPSWASPGKRGQQPVWKHTKPPLPLSLSSVSLCNKSLKLLGEKGTELDTLDA